jgi:hypothetical protein
MSALYFKNVSGDQAFENVLNWYVGPNVTAAATAPATPATGDIWVDTDDDNAVTTWSGSAWVAGGRATSVPWMADNAYKAYNLTLATGDTSQPMFDWAYAGLSIGWDGVTGSAWAITGTCDIGGFTNNGNIFGGTFSGDGFNSYGYIYGGTFSGDGFNNYGYIYGGTFSGDSFAHNNNGYIYGGTFSGDGFNNYGYIYGGTFSGDSFANNNNGYIYAGTFSGDGFNNYGYIYTGTFSHKAALSIFKSGCTFMGSYGDIILQNQSAGVLDILGTGLN